MTGRVIGDRLRRTATALTDFADFANRSKSGVIMMPVVMVMVVMAMTIFSIASLASREVARRRRGWIRGSSAAAAVGSGGCSRGLLAGGRGSRW